MATATDKIRKNQDALIRLQKGKIEKLKKLLVVSDHPPSLVSENSATKNDKKIGNEFDYLRPDHENTFLGDLS